jgi:hypothetical protein
MSSENRAAIVVVAIVWDIVTALVFISDKGMSGYAAALCCAFVFPWLLILLDWYFKRYSIAIWALGAVIWAGFAILVFSVFVMSRIELGPDM